MVIRVGKKRENDVNAERKKEEKWQSKRIIMCPAFLLLLKREKVVGGLFVCQ